jgi:hypothetical protein
MTNQGTPGTQHNDWGSMRDHDVPPQQEQEQDQKTPQPPPQATTADEVDGLKDKKPEDLTPDELRLMADTMPGEGPGD